VRKLDLGARYACDLFHLFGRPLGDFGAYLVHAKYALLDVFLVFPAVLEDVVEHAPD
jgi:hypothetical protein